ncbi:MULTISPECIES: phosphatase PAP2 family protein [unclassified Rhizobium]|uniref:phosphatase PAP2 family protein n=1 Tax=Rhizobium TaxID=379 RepID=UPI00084C5367|nr:MULTISPECIES: phosphatase PAP2 family protein [unclassified Rhizobium]OEC93079.1 phosphatase [Rhizobium sp. YK2]QYA12323.1 phosphatase PAP2 family protein [Rhizobium sp. AB2/73]UEQ81746.1 phosphatase PAP2 family protein [Rhizobium sp. AB2/73]
MIIDFNSLNREDRFPEILRPRTAGDAFIALFCLWWALLGLFSLFPQIDLGVATMFFQPQQCLGGKSDQICGIFPYSGDQNMRLLREIFFQLPYVFALVLLWMLLRCWQDHGATFNALRARNLKVALGSLLLGPVLIVNLWLKAFSGRPRPRQTDLFGGTLDFVHAGSFAGKCVSNCSFISGEAAAAGWLFCLILIIPQPYRSAAALPIAAVSILIPALRVAFGGHYLSDAVLGWLSSLVIFAALLALSQTTHDRRISEN